MSDPRIEACATAAQATGLAGNCTFPEDFITLAAAVMAKWFEQEPSIEMMAIMARHAAAGDTSASAAKARYNELCAQAEEEILR